MNSSTYLETVRGYASKKQANRCHKDHKQWSKPLKHSSKIGQYRFQLSTLTEDQD